MIQDSQTISDKAEAILQAHWNKQFPVDPVAIAMRMGATLGVCSPESGSLTIGPDRVLISTNPSEPYSRQRFTVAHEIGHWVLGHGDSFRDGPTEFNTFAPNYVEREANSFAASLLMPKAAVLTQVYNEKASVDAMARMFSVSRVAMQWRLRNLGLLQ